MIIPPDLSFCPLTIYMLTTLQYLPLGGSLENFNSSLTNSIDYLFQVYLFIGFPISSFFLIQSIHHSCCPKWSKMKIPEYDGIIAQIKSLRNLLRSAKEKKSLNLLPWHSYPFKISTQPSFQIWSQIIPPPKNTFYFVPFKQSALVLMWQNQTSLRGDEGEKSVWHTRS